MITHDIGKWGNGNVHQLPVKKSKPWKLVTVKKRCHMTLQLAALEEEE